MKNLKLLSKTTSSIENSSDFEQDIKEILEEIGKIIDVSHTYIFFNETEEKKGKHV